MADLAVGQESQRHPEISVIIPAYNASKTIRSCLKSVLAQDSGVGYEVIVVDSSIDETPEIIAHEFPLVRLVHLEQRTYPGAARNIGLECAKGETIVFIDSDCIAEADWLEKIVRSRRLRPDCAGIGGSIGNANPADLVGWGNYLIECNAFLPQAASRRVDMIPICNAAYKREVLITYGGFQIEMFGAEDRLLNWKLVSDGAVLLFDPTIRVCHINRGGFRRYLAHQFLLGQCMMRARIEYAPDLPGALIARLPFLAPLFWLFRAARVTLNVMRWNRPNLWRLVYGVPLVVIGLAAFGVGELYSWWCHRRTKHGMDS